MCCAASCWIPLAPRVPGFNELDSGARAKHANAFVEQTEGMMMMDIIAIVELCRREGLPLGQIEEAVRRYKLGVTEDPWARLNHETISNGGEIIRRRIKGQPQAVTKSLDIIKRRDHRPFRCQGSKLPDGRAVSFSWRDRPAPARPNSPRR